MRILLLNYEYPPLGGGAGLATRELAHQLAARGFEVDVVTSRSDRVRHSNGSVLSRNGVSSPVVHRVTSWRKGVHEAGLSGAATYVMAAVPVVRRLLRRHRYDVVHIYFSLPTGLLLPLASSRGVPTVVSLRGSDVPGYDPKNRRLQRLHRLSLPLTRRIWRKADQVVAVTEGLGRLAQRTEPDLRFSVVRNGVDLALFRPRDESKETDGGPVKCLCVARLVPRKGHVCLLKAFARLPRGRFVLDIAGAGGLEPVLRRLVPELGLEDTIRFHGALGHAELAEFYRNADLFTLLPEYEAFGNAFAEALASGLPVVGTRVGGIPELVEDERNGLLVAPDDPTAAATAIRRLGDDVMLRRRMASENRSKSESVLSWSTIADHYLEVYEKARAAASRARG